MSGLAPASSGENLEKDSLPKSWRQGFPSALLTVKPLNFVLVGLGRISGMHARAYRMLKGARLYGLCDLDAALLRERGKAWGVDNLTQHYEEVLADPAVDAVEILTPHHSHEEMVIQAARAGKHVSVQKPMAVTMKACEAMISACRQGGVKLRVYENFIFYPAYQEAKRLIAEGAIGEPRALRLKLGACGRGGWPVPLKTWLWRLDECHGGYPTVFDDGYHKLSLAYFFFGPVASVKGAVLRSYGKVDSPVALLFQHQQGRLSYFEASLSPFMRLPSPYYSADERVEFVGTEGSLAVTRCSGPLFAEPTLILRRGEEETRRVLPTTGRKASTAAAKTSWTHCERSESPSCRAKPARPSPVWR